MATGGRNIISIVFLFCCIIYTTESTLRVADRYRSSKQQQQLQMQQQQQQQQSSSSSSSRYNNNNQISGQIEIINICSRRRDMKIVCYCSPDEQYVPTTKAECWILQTGLHKNDTAWQGFINHRNLKNLKFLVQANGFLDYIPTIYIEQMKNLTTITIEYSQILVIKGNAFGNLQNLEEITLTNNMIEIIDKDAFANHIYLKELNLMRNQITEIDRYAFRNLPKLEKLNLGSNNITNLHDDIFNELGKLEELTLKENLISVLTSDMFKGLGNLKTLKLTRNNLNFIGDTVFAELWSLQELELDDNHIERISERALDGLNNLKTLNLRNNSLKKLDNGLLRGTPALLSINLQENLLETLTYYNFQPIMDNLVNSTSELSLSDNNFICDCRLQWIFELRNRTRNIHLKESLEEIVCTLHDEKNLKNLQQITKIDNALADNFMMNKIRQNPTIVKNLFAGNIKQQQKMRNERQQQLIKSNIYGQDNDDGLIGMFNNENRPEIDGEYYVDDETVENLSDDNDNLDNIDNDDLNDNNNNNNNNNNKKKYLLGNGRLVELFRLRAENLPCPEELNDPTELPLSRESIGMDVRSTHTANNTCNTNLPCPWFLFTGIFGVAFIAYVSLITQIH